MKSVGHVEKLTKAKSFFRDMKRSCCLTFFKASISLGSRRGRSRTLGGTSLELLDGRVPGYSRAIQLQPGVPSWMAHISRVLGLLTLDQRGPSLALGRLLLLGLLLREQLPPPPLANSFSFLFFFRLVIANRLTVGGGGEGRDRGGWDPKASLGIDPLALSARRSRKPFFLFKAISSSSSSSKLSSTRATMNLGVWTPEDLSSLSSESET